MNTLIELTDRVAGGEDPTVVAKEILSELGLVPLTKPDSPTVPPEPSKEGVPNDTEGTVKPDVETGSDYRGKYVFARKDMGVANKPVPPRTKLGVADEE